MNGISNIASAGIGPINEILENTTLVSQTVEYNYSISSDANDTCVVQGSFSVIVSPRPVLTAGLKIQLHL